MARLAHEMAGACDSASLAGAQDVLSRATQDWPTLLYGMSLVLEDQFRRRHDLEALEYAVKGRRVVMAGSQWGSATWDACTAGLGRVLHMSFQATGDPTALEESLSYCRLAVEGAPADHPRLSDRLNDLAVSSYSHYRLSGDRAALDEALGAAHRALLVVSPDREDRASLAANLSRMLEERSGPATADVIGAHTEVVAATPIDDPWWEVRVVRLSSTLMSWLTGGGRLSEVAAAVDTLRRCTRHQPPTVDGPGHLYALAAVLFVAHSTDGSDDGLLHEAIEVARRAVAAMPRGHEREAGTKTLLGKLLMRRYQHYGNAADREEALASCRGAVALVAHDDPRWVDAATQVVSALLDYRDYRSDGDGDEALLWESSALLREILARMPGNDPGRADRLADLSLALRELFQLRGEPALLEEAIEVGSMAVGLGRRGDPGRPRHLSNLGAAYGDRAMSGGHPGDLDTAIELLDDAISEVGDDRYERATYLSNLGALLCLRFERTGATSALEEGIAALRRAVADTDQDDPRRKLFLFNLNQALHPPAR